MSPQKNCHITCGLIYKNKVTVGGSSFSKINICMGAISKHFKEVASKITHYIRPEGRYGQDLKNPLSIFWPCSVSAFFCDTIVAGRSKWWVSSALTRQ